MLFGPSPQCRHVKPWAARSAILYQDGKRRIGSCAPIGHGRHVQRELRKVSDAEATNTLRQRRTRCDLEGRQSTRRHHTYLAYPTKVVHSSAIASSGRVTLRKGGHYVRQGAASVDSIDPTPASAQSRLWRPESGRTIRAPLPSPGTGESSQGTCIPPTI